MERETTLSHNQSRILFLLSLTVGVLVGLLGGIYNLITDNAVSILSSLQQNSSSVLVISVMAMCTFLSFYLVKKFAPEAGGSGVQEVEGSMIGVRKIKWKQVIPVKFIGGIAAQFGGMVVGREGPTIHLGGAIGEGLSKLWKYKVSDLDVKNHLLACGAGAGLAVAFNAPLAGILLVIEEMRPSFKFNFRSYTGIMLACYVSTWVAQFIVGNKVEVPVVDVQLLSGIDFYHFIGFGFFLSIAAVIFLKSIKSGYKVFDYLKSRSPYLTFTVVALLFAVVYQINPDLNGSGMALLRTHLEGENSLSWIISTASLRFLGGIISFCSGVVGGVFSPMLYLGSSLGEIYSMLLPNLTPYSTEFAILGMAGFFTAVVGAPVTGVILIAELTGQYELILPLGIVCLVSNFITHNLGAKPLYESLLKRDIRLFGNEKLKKNTETK
ncbi:H(+)/Cl(-) exchange transporter ClcA [Flammeovirga kamogawensis]|uniref:H(+)/Cl(-) exchange transporter ClcA n=1 Tax=Flammeovirga kamogawensis TaxID=373891 RepID=A0ABX8H1V4_9BACT|nr:H(+)/Cl(-) exchange transporter ClcA [Flammeovirga kamogawensis]MBB6463584.1 CIC family chloride channel protein [Flammeovirga kamogawensis]QWG09810.1 H(+)/Cl(-) exchange transporter ClcA [Flammeovirga kamogawensis]TRX65318.1 H(+)/Cl(-) exchange transporter ClcA [Flammeovirga kamogawensis]